MKENNILYEIRILENLIIRKVLFNKDLEIKKLPKPTPTQMRIMEYIIKNKNKNIYQRDLENVLNLRRATVSGVLKTMEKNGLVIRVVDEIDARSKKIILSSNAEKLFSLKEKSFQNIEKIIKKDISREELETFLNVINKMKSNLENN